MKPLRLAPASVTLGLACWLAAASASAQSSDLAAAADTAADKPSALSGWMFGYAPLDWHFSDAKKENDFEPDEQKHA